MNSPPVAKTCTVFLLIVDVLKYWTDPIREWKDPVSFSEKSPHNKNKKQYTLGATQGNALLLGFSRLLDMDNNDSLSSYSVYLATNWDTTNITEKTN